MSENESPQRTNANADPHPFPAPSISMPKGGGAIRSLSEKFAANPVSGAGTMSVPLPFSPGRSGFGPGLSLQYDSNGGNGPFGLGWSVSVPSISRRTDRGIPRYEDSADSDVYQFTGAEDLVPVLGPDGSRHEDRSADGFVIHRYRPRIEGLFMRIERWTNMDTGDIHWRTLTGDNVLSIYGRSDNSRIFDPSDPSRIFNWLICEQHDDKGNGILFEYVQENNENVDLLLANERNRTVAANRYLKRVKYGNKTPLARGADLHAAEWMFEAVFDYDEGHLMEAGDEGRVAASTVPGKKWSVRPDPFSHHRAGFEVRTYRRCRRFLMFHHFRELGAEPYLVRSLDFDYADFDYSRGESTESELVHQGSTRFASFLRSVTESGYIKVEPVSSPGDPDSPPESGEMTGLSEYIRQCMPPIEFEYSKLKPGREVRESVADGPDRLPPGFTGAASFWVDLNRDGLPGILTERQGSWYYSPNRGEGQFGPQRPVWTRPSAADLAGTRQRLLDLDGNGQLNLLILDGPAPGVYERADEQWEEFTPFTHRPNIRWDDPNLRFIDLDGDGRADVLITEDDVFSWHPSLGKNGFGPARSVPVPDDEEKGPRLVLADGGQSIYLADMCGDGLTDLVRIRNGEICYWPNQGYGRFGKKVTMDGAPRFDAPDQFSGARLRLVDLDGSGLTDILYLGRSGVSLYFNQSGNRWSEPVHLGEFPLPERLESVAAVDLLGTGTPCLVWPASPPGETRPVIRYLDLAGGVKPHLLVRSINNIGGETEIVYAPSTKFYFADQEAGRPWMTKLPFPVQLVERIEVRDHVAGHRSVNRFAYHHGCYDGEEREFRGFAMVERWDAESWETADGAEHALDQPPVTTRTWYHTGFHRDRERIVHQQRDEYYRREQHTPEPILPEGLDDGEWREALRALKGLPLRQEVYSFDGSPSEMHPYYVEEFGYEIKLVQRRGEARHAVFLTVASEKVTLQYERNPEDPRFSQVLVLQTNELGQTLASCTVAYGRRTADAALPAEAAEEQLRTYITYEETEYTQDIDVQAPAAVYRLRIPHASRSYEITGMTPASGRFRPDELKYGIEIAVEIPYEEPANGTSPKKRLLAHSRTVFLDDRLLPMPSGRQGPLGLVHQSYRLAFTPGTVAAHYAGRIADADFERNGYVRLDGEDGWWIPSGTAVYPDDPAAHFYLPVGMRDPFGLVTEAVYDRYDFLPERVRVRQASWNETIAVNDYRILGPVMVVDPNKNRAAAEYDALGTVIASAVMGKEGEHDGDTLDDPTVRIEYDLFQWMNRRKPNFVRTTVRERHGNANQRWQVSYTYTNGRGGVAMVKAQAPPGKALQAGPDGTVAEIDADPRWIGNGRTIVNNKGNPVKKYEPYFSATHEYEDEKALREFGVTPILYYDALGRNIRTEFPNGTFAKVEFGPWKQKIYDVNDTVKESRWYAERGSPDPESEPEPANDPERRAAWLAAKHADTPGAVYLDSLGRPFYSVADYGQGKTAATRAASDLTGRYARLFDQAGREIANGFTGMTGIPVYSFSAERGRRWTFQNIFGAMVKTWDEYGREFRTEYDELHRPVSMYVREPGEAEKLFQHFVYGDRHPEAERLNLLGAVHQMFDTAGMMRVPEADFKGNPLRIERCLARDYKSIPDWSPLAAQDDYEDIQHAAEALLDLSAVHETSAAIDALGRPTEVTLSDGTVLHPVYNEANLLASLGVQIGGAGTSADFLKAQEYNAKGQRLFARFGNDVVTRYSYQADTQRLSSALTYRTGTDPALSSLQHLHYVYDPVGNMTQIRDDAQQTHYFRNSVVRPENRYEYDAMYQLIRATGREHAGIVNDSVRTGEDLGFIPELPHHNQTDAVRTYTEEYEYDPLGNLTRLRHRYRTEAASGGGWTRHYRYRLDGDPGDRTNRLAATSTGGDPEDGPYSAHYDYDNYGNMIRMPHLAEMVWDFQDRLRKADLGGGGTAYYVYGADGQRVRKVIERPGGLRAERVYMGAVEYYREYQEGSAPHLERRTLHISDNAGRIAQVDVKTRDDRNVDPANPLNVPLIRYVFGNHLGSAMLETDETGAVISYEEYHPYGTTAYRSCRPGVDLSLKRYRFSGKERDSETGLDYFGARYYASWLGRWTSGDPAGFASGFNLYRYCRNNPVVFHDPNGMQEALNPAGEVSWEIPSRVFLDSSGRRLTDEQALANFENWLRDTHPDRRYEPGSLSIRWTTRRGRSVPVFNARWLRSDGTPLLPTPGQVGSVERHDRHPPALRAVPGDTSSPRISEDEHVIPRAQAEDMTTDPQTGRSDYTRRRYETDTTLRATRSSALYKTHGNRGGPTADNPTTRALRERVASGGTIDYREDIFERSRRQAIAAGMPEEAVNRAALEQEGNLFSMHPTVRSGGGSSAQPSSGAGGAGAGTSGSTTSGGSGGAGAARGPAVGGGGGFRAGGLIRAGSGEIARTVIPGFVEAEIAGIYAHSFVTGTLGITSGPAAGVALAISSSPTQFAAAVTLPAMGGAVVGNVVESAVTSATGSRAVGIGAAVAGAAATGAVIGTFIPIPGVGTAAGAAIGAAIGVIGYGLSKLFW